MPRKKRKRKEKSEAVKVDHSDALIPSPSVDMLAEVASGIHIAVSRSAEMLDGECYIPWERLTDMERLCWMEGARCAYAIIAIHGGAEVNEIAKPD